MSEYREFIFTRKEIEDMLNSGEFTAARCTQILEGAGFDMTKTIEESFNLSGDLIYKQRFNANDRTEQQAEIN